MWWFFKILWVTFDNTSGILELFFNEKHEGKKMKKNLWADIFADDSAHDFHTLHPHPDILNNFISWLILYRSILWNFPSHYIPLIVIAYHYLV